MTQTEQDYLNAETDQVVRFLDRLEGALFGGGFQAYADLVALPYVVTTRNTRFVYTTRDHLRRSYDTWQRTIQAHSATTLVQRVTQVERLGQDGLIVDYDSLLMAGNRHVLPRFKNLMFLTRRNEDWVLEQLVSGVSNRGPSLFIRVDPGNGAPKIAPKVTPPQGQDLPAKVHDAED